MTYGGSTFYINATAAAIYNNNSGGSITLNTPNAGGNVYINSNNVAGMTVSSSAIVLSLNTTLPTLGVAPAVGQLGYFNSTNVALSSLLSGSVRIVSTYTSLAAGTYILNGSFAYTCTTAGTISQIGCGFSTSNLSFASTGPFWLSNNLNLATQTFAVNAAVSYMNSTCTVTLLTATTFYFIGTWIGGSGAFNAGGSSSYTRIA